MPKTYYTPKDPKALHSPRMHWCSCRGDEWTAMEENFANMLKEKYTQSVYVEWSMHVYA